MIQIILRRNCLPINKSNTLVTGIQVKEDTWYMWVVGVCVGTFVILVTLAIVGPYFMWKHRVILVMKIVHYFQAYEDDGKIPLYHD